MKALGNILLVLLLMISNSGLTLSKHYCMGRLEAVSIMEKAPSCADKMGMDEECPLGCCEDHEDQLSTDDQSKTQHSFQFSVSVPPIDFREFFIALNTFEDNSTNNHTYNLDPSPPGADLTIWHQTFLL